MFRHKQKVKTAAATTATAKQFHLTAFGRAGIRKQQEYFIDNLAMLLLSGIDVLTALVAIEREIKSRRMRQVIDQIRSDVDAGVPLWQALEKIRLLPGYVISLLKIGERSGRLPQNLQVIVVQQHKDRALVSKIRSAVMYPLLTMSLTIVVGLGIAFFILPNLTTMFKQMNIPLPLVTRILIAGGNFLAQWGAVALPALLLIIFGGAYLLFFYRKTRFIGQRLLFFLPGLRRLVQDVELTRMGYLTSTLLQAGLPILDALHALQNASSFVTYVDFYRTLADRVEQGQSFANVFTAYKKSYRLVPPAVQQMIVAGEQSGHLLETMRNIGEVYEAKTDAATKDLAVLIEPVLLVIVWLGVVAVALAVILPVYSLVGGIE